MPSPEDIDITTVDFEEMIFTVERVFCKKHDISINQSVDAPRGTGGVRETVQSETTDSDE